VQSALVMGYPKFEQEGLVPREDRPVTWFREGGEGPEFESQASSGSGDRPRESKNGESKNGESKNGNKSNA